LVREEPVSIPRTLSRLEVWERREAPAFRILPLALLAVCTVLSVVILGWGPRAALDVGLSVAAAVWTVALVIVRPGWVDERPRLMAVFFVVLIALMAALVLSSGWYGFYSWTGYFYAYRCLRGRWRFAGMAAVAVVTATAQAGGVPGAEAAAVLIYAIVVLINLAAVAVVTLFSWIGDEQRRRSEQAVAELTEVNQRLAESLQVNAGLHRQLLTQARDAGIQEERQRLAGEIHDTLAQGLIGIITQLQAADQAGAPEDERRRHLDAAAALARESLSEARRSVRALRPEPLEGARLPEALSEVAERWSGLNGVAAEVTTTGPARAMRPEIEVALLRTAQEALANVARHAGASRVVLTLSYMGDQVTLDVRDDGVGFEPPAGEPRALPAGAEAEGGFGLTAMRQRLNGLAGTLEIESEPGSGTALSATLPAIPAGAAA
jgi:signal transduction histidine kinase